MRAAVSSGRWAEGRDRRYSFVSRRSNISKLMESLDKFVLSQSRRLRGCSIENKKRKKEKKEMKAKRRDKEGREETNCSREIVADRQRIERERERERWTGRKQMWFARTGNLQLEEYGLACKPHWNSRRARNCSGVELWASCCNLLFSLQPLASSFLSLFVPSSSTCLRLVAV